MKIEGELARQEARGVLHDGPAADIIEAGVVFSVAHPFCREKVSLPGDDPEGPYSVETMSWRPGIRYEYGDNAYGDDPDTVKEYDGMGAQILTVVAVFKPGRFPTRVFYTRKWRTPDGKEFGKGGLRIKITSAFKRLIAGYRFQSPPRLKVSAEWFAAELSKAALANKPESLSPRQPDREAGGT